MQVHQPELAGDLDEEQESRFEQGYAVGLLAQSAFPGGVLVQSGPDDLEASLTRTAALMADSEISWGFWRTADAIPPGLPMPTTPNKNEAVLAAAKLLRSMGV